MTVRGGRGAEPFLRHIELVPSRIPETAAYPFNIPAIQKLGTLQLSPKITFLVGENGTGKSTLIEALAIALGFNPEGGSRNLHFSTRASESELHRCLRIARSARKPRDGFFLRAESLFNVATEIDRLDDEPMSIPLIDAYGGISLHEQSHGESFIAIARNRFRDDGLYLLDEPEAALSPSRQLALMRVLHDRCNGGSQFVIATHSPILLAYPGALIYELTSCGIRIANYDDLEHVALSRQFLTDPAHFLRHLFMDDD